MFTEKLLKDIEVSDGFKINGSLLSKDGNNSIIISCHGLGGTQDNYMNLKIRDYIIENNLNFDNFRFNFYKQSDNYRSFLNTTIASQVRDLEQLIDFFSVKYENIYLVGASYGGLTCAVLNSQKVTKQALIDPSFVIDVAWAQANTVRLIDFEKNVFTASFDKHLPMLINDKMKNEGLTWTPLKSQEYIKRISLPTLIMQANSPYYQLSKSLDYNNQFIKTVYVDEADHSFTSLNAMNTMLKEVFEHFNA